MSHTHKTYARIMEDYIRKNVSAQMGHFRTNIRLFGLLGGEMLRKVTATCARVGCNDINLRECEESEREVLEIRLSLTLNTALKLLYVSIFHNNQNGLALLR